MVTSVADVATEQLRYSAINSPNAEQFGFSHIDGSPGASGGNAVTPHAAQIGDSSPFV
jgi:hypothetical protein